MTPEQLTFGQRLREQRLRLSANQEQLASLIRKELPDYGLGKTVLYTVSRWERGQTEPGPAVQHAILELLGRQALNAVPEDPKLKKWGRLKFHDPEHVLQAYRTIELLEGLNGLPERARELKGSMYRDHREGRQAALFCHGMAGRLGTKVFFSRPDNANGNHDREFDCVCLWQGRGTASFAPLQLKELPVPRGKQKPTLQRLLDGLKKYGDAPQLIVAIHTSGGGQLDFDDLTIPDLGVAAVYVFGAAKPDQSEWFLVGDLLSEGPAMSRFRYPEPTA